MMIPRETRGRVAFLGVTAFISGVLLTSLVALETTNVGRSTYMTSVGTGLYKERMNQSLDISADVASAELCNRLSRSLGTNISIGIAAVDLGIALKRDVQYIVLAERWAQISLIEKVRFILGGMSEGEVSLINQRLENYKRDLQGSFRLARYLEVCGQHP